MWEIWTDLNRTLLELKLFPEKRIRNNGNYLNRTLLELKLWWPSIISYRSDNLNRTLLELKQVNAEIFVEAGVISIAPYWNWNSITRISFHVKAGISIAPYWNWNLIWLQRQWIKLRSQSHLIGIETTGLDRIATAADNLNRTLLELKQWRLDVFRMFQVYLNRTLLELKLASRQSINRFPPYLNRTLLELKLGGAYAKERKERISIAPYWNWNLLLHNSKVSVRLISIAPYWNWNHIAEWGIYWFAKISIAPYWNWNRESM